MMMVFTTRPRSVRAPYLATAQRTPYISPSTKQPSGRRQSAPSFPATMIPQTVSSSSLCAVRERVQHDTTTTCFPDDAPPDSNVAMRFELHCAPPPPPGSRMLLLGSAHALGAWNVCKAVPLQCVQLLVFVPHTKQPVISCMDNNWWSTPHLLHLPAGALLEYKYAIIPSGSHELQWQGGINESAQLPQDSEGRIWILKDEWDCSDHVLLTGAHESEAVECVLVREDDDDD